jgi:hypothetical protein
VGYDVFIFTLTILGISAVVVFSYKIFHSRVYPVGIVRKVSAQREEETAILPYLMTGADVAGIVPEDWSSGGISVDLKLSGKTVAYYILKHQLSGRQDKAVLIRSLRNKYLHGRPEDLALAKEAAEREEALKLRSRIEDMEKRIRELEIKSVQQLQETAEETLQPPQVVH